MPSFFLEFFLHWSPVAYGAPTDLESSSFSFLSFCLFILFMGFSRQEYWSGLPFPSPVDHILSDLSTMTRLCWVVAWLSFIELVKAVVCVIRLTSFLWLWFQCVCLLMRSRSTYLGRGVSLHGCSSKAQPLLLTLDVGLLLSAAAPGLRHGVASWQIDGKQWKQWQTLFSWAPKTPWTVTEAMKLKDVCSLEEKLWQT